MTAGFTPSIGSLSSLAKGARRARIGLTAALVVSLLSGACKRHADVRDELNAPPLRTPPTITRMDTRTIDSGLGTAAFPVCANRPIGKCQGANDFPCAFSRWAIEMAKKCQEQTGCVTNGSVDIRMGADGCVGELRMSEPNDEFVACLVQEFGSVKCPCGEDVATYFLGIGNNGCQLCGGQEFPCPAGLVCVQGVCKPTGGDASANAGGM